jgi:hypothetical protein
MPRTMICQQMHALRASKHCEDFCAGRALVHASMRQHGRCDPSGRCATCVLLACHRKGGWHVKGMKMVF